MRARPPWIGAAVAGLVMAGGALAAPGAVDRLVPGGFAVRGSESARATELLTRATGHRPLPELVVVLSRRAGLGRPVEEVALQTLVSELHSDPLVGSVRRGPRPRRVTTLLVRFRDSSERERRQAVRRLRQDLDPGPLSLALAGRTVQADRASRRLTEQTLRSLAVAVPPLVLAIVLAGETLVAAVAILASAVLAVLAWLLVMAGLDSAFDVPTVALPVGVVLGSVLGIHFGLTVQRRGCRHAIEPVLFAAAATALACGSLGLVPLRTAAWAGLAGALAAVLAAGAALAGVPAVQTLAGARIQRLRVLGDRVPGAGLERFYSSMLERPWVLSAALLVGLALPGVLATQAFLSRADSGSTSMARPGAGLSRAAERRLAPPVLVVVRGANGPELRRYRRRLGGLAGVRRVSRPFEQAPGTRLLEVRTGRSAGARVSLRAAAAARALRGRFETSVGGDSAALLDQRDRLGLPLYLAMAAAAGLVLSLLVALSHSMLLAVKGLMLVWAAPLAALGVAVRVFQDGRLTALEYRPRGELDATGELALLAIALGAAAAAGVLLVAELRAGPAPGPRRAARLSAAAVPGLTAALVLAACGVAWARAAETPLVEAGLGLLVAGVLELTAVRFLLAPALAAAVPELDEWLPNPIRRALARLPRRRGS